MDQEEHIRQLEARVQQLEARDQPSDDRVISSLSWKGGTIVLGEHTKGDIKAYPCLERVAWYEIWCSGIKQQEVMADQVLEVTYFEEDV